jgi:hypothetical protein
MPKQKGIIGLDELRKKLQNAPEKLRLQQLYGALRQEATPLRNSARAAAYEDVNKQGTNELFKAIKITRARVKAWRDEIGVWIGPTRVSKAKGDAQSYPFMQLYGRRATGTNKGYQAKDYMGKAWEALGASTRARIDRVGKSKWQQQLRQALK